MKKQTFSIFLVLTLLFCMFTLGFFLGKNQNHSSIALSALPRQPLNSPVETISAAKQTDPPEPEITYPVDINTAQLEELTALPGIGETLAKRILTYRNLHGPFSRPEELMNVEGIGSGKLEAILDYITAGG